jgi:hypothetical protein
MQDPILSEKDHLSVFKHQNDLEKENAKHAMSLYAAKEKEEIDKDPNKFVKND